MSSDASQRRDVAALKRAHPIASVIAGYGVELRPAGDVLIGRCPFHDDSEQPNLHVYPSTDSSVCFRCGRRGDAIDFVQRREKLSFLAACDRLEGLPPSATQPTAGKAPADGTQHTPDEQRVLDVAMRVYHESLQQTPAALAYLAQRGISREVIGSGILGYADGHSLVAALAADIPVAETLGLLRRDGRGGLVERFAGRIVVAEQRDGHAVWCVGRAWETVGPKFLSLPGPRPLLGAARVKDQSEAFLVEGLFDWLTAIGWGLPACSLCGTHGSEQQLRALDGVSRVYGVFNGSVARRAAAERIGRRFGARWRPIPLPEGTDLNDIGQRPNGRQQFVAYLQAIGGMDNDQSRRQHR